MEFTKNSAIINNDKFIIFGQIKDTCAVIFSSTDIEKIKLNLDKNQFDNESFWTFDINDNKINVVCQKEHLNENSKDKYVTIIKKKRDYKNKILPYINNIYDNNTKWIFDILNKNKEQNKVLYDDDKIMIVKDQHFNEQKKQSFYLLVFPFDKLKTIRDLRSKHIELLKLMKLKCITLAKEYGINENELYFFFHYHPSFYHLHLHCCIINHKSLTTKYFRCKMLDTILSNLELKSNYYRDKDIKFEIPEKHVIVRLLSKENE